jgi:ribonuclease Z
MKITFIGTGSGKTSLTRNHSSVFIQYGKSNLLLDTGDGISRAFLSQNIFFNHIKNILITHFHPDHFSGLFSLIIQMKLSGRKTPLTIYIDKKLTNTLENLLTNTYLFREKMKFQLSVIPTCAEKEFSISPGFFINTFQNSHIIREKYPKKYSKVSFVSNSILLTVGKKRIVYTSDIGKAEDVMIPELKSPDILISETTHISTSDLENIFTYLNPVKIYLTHISDEDFSVLRKWQMLLSEEVKKSLKFAEEGMIIK